MQSKLKDIIEVCKRLYERRYISPISGNVSHRTEDGNILITPSRVRKFQITENQLCKIDLDGKSLTPEKTHSSEYRVHLKVYKGRQDVRAIIHAHPPFSIVCSLATITFDEPILPETALSLGSIPTIPYAPPGSEELAESIAPYLEDHNAMILQRHGVITFGEDLWEAFDRLEEVEHAANIAYHLSLKGRIPVLGRSQLMKLANYAKDQGFPVPEYAMNLLFRILAK